MSKVPVSTVRTIRFKTLELVVPSAWREVEANSWPYQADLTLNRYFDWQITGQYREPGVIDYLLTTYRPGQAPRSTSNDLLKDIIEFGRRYQWGPPTEELREHGSRIRLAAATYSTVDRTLDDTALRRVWHLSDGHSFLLMIYEVWREFSSDELRAMCLRECEEIVLNVRFFRHPPKKVAAGPR
jgi:hypothetical protein